MESYATRQFRENKGYVEGQFVVQGQNVKYLDLPSECEKGTLQLRIDGKELTKVEIIPQQRIVRLKSGCFQEGDTIHFAYIRDPLTLWGEAYEDPCDDDEPYGPPSVEALNRAEEYTYVTKKTGEDYISFVQEMPEVFAFGNTTGQSLCELQYLMAHHIDANDDEGLPYPPPFSYDEVVP